MKTRGEQKKKLLSIEGILRDWELMSGGIYFSLIRILSMSTRRTLLRNFPCKVSEDYNFGKRNTFIWFGYSLYKWSNIISKLVNGSDPNVVVVLLRVLMSGLVLIFSGGARGINSPIYAKA